MGDDGKWITCQKSTYSLLYLPKKKKKIKSNDEAEAAIMQTNVTRVDQISKALTAAYVKYTLLCMDVPFQHAPNCIRLSRALVDNEGTTSPTAMDIAPDHGTKPHDPKVDRFLYLVLSSQTPLAKFVVRFYLYVFINS